MNYYESPCYESSNRVAEFECMRKSSWNAKAKNCFSLIVASSPSFHQRLSGLPFSASSKSSALIFIHHINLFWIAWPTLVQNPRRPRVLREWKDRWQTAFFLVFLSSDFKGGDVLEIKGGICAYICLLICPFIRLSVCLLPLPWCLRAHGGGGVSSQPL